MFRLSNARPADGEQPDFAPIIEALKRKRDSTEEIEKVYSSELIPIHLVAEAKGISDLQALAGLADSDEVPIRPQSPRPIALKEIPDATIAVLIGDSIPRLEACPAASVASLLEGRREIVAAAVSANELVGLALR